MSSSNKRITKSLIAIAISTILSLCAVTQNATAATAVLPVFGDSGEVVTRLQQALISRGFTLRGGANGSFSANTRTTLKNFQKVVGFKPTGKLDERTAKFLGLVAPDQPQPIATPSQSPVSVQAVVAPTVQVATAQVAQPVQVASSPIAGQLTIDTLPVRGQTSDAVRLVQEHLITNGITVKGGVDGVFGVATAIALANFQTSRGINVTSAVDLQTAVALGVLPDLATLGISQISVFPSQGRCSFVDSWHWDRGGRQHQGVDIIGPRGLALYAVSDGTITKMYGADSTLSGNALRLTAADGTYYFYAHLDSFAGGIAVSSQVRAGQIIGYMGSTGNAGTPHLHFEVHPGGGSAVNPYPVIKAVDACHVTDVLPQP